MPSIDNFTMDEKLKSLYHLYVKGSNYSTPIIIGYLRIGRFIIELSRDDAPVDSRKYNISVADITFKKYVAFLSRPIRSIAELNDFIDSLKNKPGLLHRTHLNNLAPRR